MKSILVDKANQYLKDHRKRKIFFGVVAVLSAVTIFGVNRFLTRPAISMERQNIVMSASPSDAEMGDTITVTISALAKSSQKYTSFLILSESTGAGLTDDYIFSDDNSVKIAAENNKVLKLHRFLDENGKVDYYFTLKKNETVTFTLNCISDASADDLRATGSDAVSDSLEKMLDSIATSSDAGSDLFSAEMETATSSDLTETIAVTDKTTAANSVIRITNDPVTTASVADAETKVQIIADNDEDNALPDGEVFESAALASISQDTASSESVTASSSDGEKQIEQNLIMYYGSGITLKEAYQNICTNMSDADASNSNAIKKMQIVLNWFKAVVRLSDQTLDAKIYTDNTLTTELNEGDSISISGMLPLGAVAKAYPVQVDMGGKKVLAAFDITIYEKDGTSVFEPDQSVRVKITTPTLKNVEKADIYHLNEKGSVPEQVADQINVSDQNVEFDADHFSTYVLTVSLEEVTAGKTYNLNRGDSLEVSMTDTSGGVSDIPSSPSKAYYSNKTIHLLKGSDQWSLSSSGTGVSILPETENPSKVVVSATGNATETTWTLTHQYSYYVCLRKNGRYSWNLTSTTEKIYLKVSDINQVTITVNKVWSDIESNRHEGDPVTVNLYRNGESLGEKKTLSSSNSWTDTFTAPYSNFTGSLVSDTPCQYGIYEDPVPYYTTSVAVNAAVPDAASGSYKQTITVTNTYNAETQHYELSIGHNKMIDYLGDKGGNPDTDIDENDTLDISDLYRLYLDVVPDQSQTPVDLLLVIDTSSSMYNSTPNRLDILKRILTGTNNNDSNDNFITNYCKANPGARINIEYFNYTAGESNPDLGWSTDVTAIKNAVDNIPKQPGTNYVSALHLAANILKGHEESYSDHPVRMIFLSDGVPYTYSTYDSAGNETPHPVSNSEAVGPSEEAILNFKETHLGMLIDTVGFGNTTSGDDLASVTLLEDLVTAGLGGKYFTAPPDYDALKEQFDALMSYMRITHLVVNDQLSSSLHYYSDQPDVKLVQVNGTTKEETVLYDKNGMTDSGKQIISKLILPDITLTVSSDGTVSSTQNTVPASGGTVRIEFNPSHVLSGAIGYKISFNVDVTETAYDDYASGGYTAAGEKGTDYTGNNTSYSSDGSYNGLYSNNNDNAFINYVYTHSDEQHTDKYSKPVVQVKGKNIELKKVSADNENATGLSGAEFDLYLASQSGVAGSIAVPGLKDAGGNDMYGIKEATAASSKESGKEGTLSFTGLMPGTYYLVETKAPDGYYGPTKPIAFKIGKSGYSMLTDSVYSQNYTEGTDKVVKIQNSSGAVLPNSGSSGTTLFTMLGILLMAMAGMVYRKIILEERRQNK